MIGGILAYRRGLRPKSTVPMESGIDCGWVAWAAHVISFDVLMSRCYSIGVPNKAPRAKADVLQGTLDMMVLQTLDSLGPLHGYAIAARLEQVSGGARLARERHAWDRMAGIIHSALHDEA